jgi:acyl carrier protein
MTPKQIEEKVRKIIVEQLDISEEDILPESSFKDDLGADSLELLDLVMKMEEEFDIQISDEDAEEIISVQDAIERIEKNLPRG